MYRVLWLRVNRRLLEYIYVTYVYESEYQLGDMSSMRELYIEDRKVDVES